MWGRGREGLRGGGRVGWGGIGVRWIDGVYVIYITTIWHIAYQFPIWDTVFCIHCRSLAASNAAMHPSFPAQSTTFPAILYLCSNQHQNFIQKRVSSINSARSGVTAYLLKKYIPIVQYLEFAWLELGVVRVSVLWLERGFTYTTAIITSDSQPL